MVLKTGNLITGYLRITPFIRIHMALF